MLQDLNYAQRERLGYLELRTFFIGELRRADLESRFGIRPAAATRDLNAYRALAPENLVYDASAKTYVPSERFRPVFPFSSDRILSWLLNGFGDGVDTKVRRSIPCEGPASLISPDFKVLAGLTRSIHCVRPVQVDYLSLSSGATRRVIVPVALADNGSRWHVRGYDRQRQRFGDFVLTRISRLKSLSEKVEDHERITADVQWNRFVNLELVPHPGLTHPEAIAADYGMGTGALRLKVRAALAGYALNRWAVDSSPDHVGAPSRYHLWLRNSNVLDGVESAVMAPGYSTSGVPDAHL